MNYNGVDCPLCRARNSIRVLLEVKDERGTREIHKCVCCEFKAGVICK